MKFRARHTSGVPPLARPAAVCALLLLGTAPGALAEDGFIVTKNGCKIGNPAPKPEETVTWSGPCVNGFAEGKGIMQWYVSGEPSTRYEGTMKAGLLSGQGKLTMPSGASYDGGWRDGKQDGRGVQAMPDGTRYEGEWKNGQPDGHGKMRNAAGETFEGDWKEGAYLGPDGPK